MRSRKDSYQCHAILSKETIGISVWDTQSLPNYYIGYEIYLKIVRKDSKESCICVVIWAPLLLLMFTSPLSL